MALPVKITPDNLKDSIFQIRFESTFEELFVLGEFKNITKDILSYHSSESIKNIENKEFTIERKDVGYFTDMNSVFKININENSISFNVIDNYVGWNNYFLFISDVIKKLYDNCFFKSFSSLGIRFISIYESNILENLKIKFDNFLNPTNTNTHISTRFIRSNSLVILNVINSITDNDRENSYIDIDIVKKLNNEFVNYEELISVVSQMHQTEKEIFFSILSDDYLKTLNPSF
jgi:uncharacterized protein (TIGR04255 family)